MEFFLNLVNLPTLVNLRNHRNVNSPLLPLSFAKGSKLKYSNSFNSLRLDSLISVKTLQENSNVFHFLSVGTGTFFHIVESCDIN